MTLNDLKLRARALLRPNRVEQELEEELAFHIERETRKLIDEGMTPAEACQRAQARFGSTPLAADRCRDERGTAVIDNTIRDVQYALRAFAKAPLAALTIVVTVALGLGMVAVLFTVLNTLIFRVDQVPDIGEMYAVERIQLANGDGSPLTRPMFEAMRADTHVFTDAYATVPDIVLHVGGRRMAVTLVTGNFFQVVRVNPVMGRALMPADDARSGGNAVIVLSHKGGIDISIGTRTCSAGPCSSTVPHSRSSASPPLVSGAWRSAAPTRGRLCRSWGNSVRPIAAARMPPAWRSFAGLDRTCRWTTLARN